MTLQGKDDNTSNYSFVIGKRTFWTYVVGVLSLMVAAFMMEDILLMAQSGLDTLGIEVTKIDINNENYYTRSSSSSSVPYTATTGYRGVASATTASASEVLTAPSTSDANTASDASAASDASVASEWNYYPTVEKSTEATTTTTKAPRGGGRGARGRGKKANQGDSNNNPQAAAANANTVVQVTAAPTTMAPTEAPRGRGRGRGKKANNNNNAISSTATTTVTMTANNNNVLLETDNNTNNIIQQVEEESTAAPQKTGRGGRAGRGNNQNKNNNLRADTTINLNNNDSDNVQVVEEEEEKIDPAVAARDLAARQEVWKALNDPALLKEQDSDPFYCRWAPDDVDDYKSTEHCKTKWTTPQICNNANDANNNPNRIGTRVLGFGDSTMSQQNFLIKHVIQRLDIPSIDNPNYKGRSEFCRTDSKTGFRCRWKQSTRCDNRDFFGFQNVTEYTHTVLWNRQPVWGVEGPMSIGRKTPGCSDCKHCETGYVNCEPVDDTDENHPCQESKLPKTTQHVYQGGYINVEFARDVILQTNFFNTSQENIALFLKRQYNTPELVRAFGKPYCFVNTGHHDITIRETTLDIFLENVEWYLRLLHPVCRQIIWIGTNAPESNGGPFMQKIGNTYEWGEAVRKLLRKTQFGGGGGKGQPKPQRIPYLDVYNASLTYAHRDNIHMNQSWYKSLANFVGDLMESCHEVTTRDS